MESRRRSAILGWCVHAFMTAVLIGIIWRSWPARFSIGDAVAQFLPLSIHGARSVLAGELPLFNFYQMLGHPLLEAGYYPVLYPLLWISYLFGARVLGDEQQTWNVLCCLQLFLNSLICFAFFRRTLQVSTLFASIGALSVAFSGMALWQGQEWFYSLMIYGALPLCLMLTRELLEKPTLLRALLLGFCAALFVYGSNLNYTFFAIHPLALATCFWFFSIIEKRDRIRMLGYLAFSAVCAAALIVPYLHAVAVHAGQTIREVGAVPLDKYYWNIYHWRDALMYTWYPEVDFAGPTDLPPTAYYFGFLSALGICVAPIAAIFLLYSPREQRINFLWLLLSALFTLLMALGPDGILSGLLYHVPPYGWFAHTGNWAGFFQISAIAFGILSLEILFRNSRSSPVRIAAWAVSVLSLCYTVAHFPQTKRLTDVEPPLLEPQLAFDTTFRHAGIWHDGELYNGDWPMPILGHNYATFWKLPAFYGYEPLILRKNFEALGDHFFPGYEVDATRVNLRQMAEYGVRYLHMPPESADATIDILGESEPNVSLRDLGVDRGSGARVFKLFSAKPLVFGNTVVLEQLRIYGNYVRARITTGEKVDVTFNWLAHPNFRILLDGRFKKWREDELGRPVFNVNRAGSHSVELRYYPRKFIRAFIIGLSCFAALFAGAVALSIAARRRS